jgi:hypothetical protein
MDRKFFTESVTHSILFTVAAIMCSILLFMAAEPSVSRGASASTTDTFTIRQQITDEISFVVPATDVTMVGTIAGVTGGQATGSTQFAVRSNSNSGYTVDISFLNSPAMRGEATLSQAIRNYMSTTTEPTYSFNSSTSAMFGYTVSASTTSDLDPSFLDNGSNACNTGAADTGTVATCWMAPSTTNFRIINRSTAATTSATSTLTFRVVVPSNPVPGVEEDYYTATATLTATNQ